MHRNRRRAIAKNIAVAALVLAGILSIYVAYVATWLGTVDRVLLPVSMMIFVGVLISTLKSYRSAFVVYIVGGRRGIGLMDRLARHWRGFWESMAELGIALGFGLMSYKISGGRISRRVLAIALITIFLMIALLLPLMGNALYFINIPQIQRSITFAPGLRYASILGYMERAAGVGGAAYGMLTLVTLLTGFTGFIVLLLAINGFEIIKGTAEFAAAAAAGHQQLSILTSQVPGAAPVIPGIFIPLIPGIIAIAIMLIVHEGSHGVLARLAKVRLLSTGLLVFGIIPVGGYVEPDEKQVARLKRRTQTRIMSAGISANFLAAVAFAVPMVLILALVPNLYVQQFTIASVAKGYPAYNIVPVGSKVIAWNGRQVTSYNALIAATRADKPGGVVVISTSSGTYSLRAVASQTNASRGVIGVEVGSGFVPGITGTYGGKLLFFMYTLFALLVMLNFFVAVFNLLPMPGLDGWRIYKINVRDKRIIKTMAILVVALLLINILPLFYALA